MSEFTEWESFYVIVGAAAGALIGLQFVVLTLIAERPSARVAQASSAFVTPTIVHFSASLFLSALQRVPLEGTGSAAVLWGLTGVCGLAYVAVVTRRVRTARTVYEPVFEDHLFHILLPLASYAVLILSAVAAMYDAHIALFGVGGVALALLFVGIHNAWDSVAYYVFVNRPELNAERGTNSGSADGIQPEALQPSTSDEAG